LLSKKSYFAEDALRLREKTVADSAPATLSVLIATPELLRPRSTGVKRVDFVGLPSSWLS
jgi:hypothetical protein